MTCKLIDRRGFLKTAGTLAAGLALGTTARAQAETKPAQTTIPRWRGFNLVDFFQAFDRGELSAGLVSEDDLTWIRDWGFDFIRMPITPPGLRWPKRESASTAVRRVATARHPTKSSTPDTPT